MSSEDDVKEFLKELSETDFSDIRSAEATWLVEMQYQGFDYYKVLEAFVTKAKSAQKATGLTSVQILRKICSFFVVRGASTADSVLAKMEEREASEFKKIINGLQLTTKKPERSDELTISRIVSVFPGKVAQLLAGIQDTSFCRVVGWDKLDAETKQKVPKYLCFPQAAALFPLDDATYKELYGHWKLWLEQFSKIIVTRTEKKAAEEGKTKQTASYYADLANTASKAYFKDDVKKATLVSLAKIKSKTDEEIRAVIKNKGGKDESRGKPVK